MGLRLADLSADLREHYEERAAILEFDAGMPRRVAEAAALQEVLEMQTRISASLDKTEWGHGLRQGAKERRTLC